jgi:hypothetical protein
VSHACQCRPAATTGTTVLLFGVWVLAWGCRAGHPVDGRWSCQGFVDAAVAEVRPRNRDGFVSELAAGLLPCFAQPAAVCRQALVGVLHYKSRCAVDRCRRYHLRKALGAPPPPAPSETSRSSCGIVLRVHGCVWRVSRAPALGRRPLHSSKPRPLPRRPFAMSVLEDRKHIPRLP